MPFRERVARTNGGGSPHPPESPNRPRCGGGSHKRQWPQGPRPQRPRLRHCVPNFRPPRTCAGCSARPPRAGAERPPPAGGRKRAASPASGLTARGTRGAGASGSGQWRIPVPPPSSPPRTTAPPRAALRSRTAGQRCGSVPDSERPGSARTPRPGRGRWDGARRLRGAGTTFRVRPRPAPCPRAAERSALRRWRQDTAAPARLIRGPCAAPF